MSLKGERNYYDYEDHPVVAAVYDARVYNIPFSNEVNSIQVKDRKDELKKLKQLFNPLSKTSTRSK